MSRLLFEFFDDGTRYPLPVSVAASLPTPTVQVASDVTLFPSPVGLTISKVNFVVSNSIPRPNAVSVAVTIPAPVVTISNAHVFPSPRTLTISLPTPYISPARLITPSPLALVGTLPAVTKTNTGDLIVTPNPVSTTFTTVAGTVVLSGRSTLRPSPLFLQSVPVDLYTGDTALAADDRIVLQKYVGLISSGGEWLSFAPSSITCSKEHQFGDAITWTREDVSVYPFIPLQPDQEGTFTLYEEEGETIGYRIRRTATITWAAEGSGHTVTISIDESLEIAEQSTTVTAVFPTDDSILELMTDALDTDQRLYLKIRAVDVYASGATRTWSFIPAVIIEDWSRSRTSQGARVTVQGSAAAPLNATNIVTYSNTELSEVNLSGEGESSTRGKSFKTPIVDPTLNVGAIVESDSGEFVNFYAKSVTLNLSTSSKSMVVTSG